MLKTIFIGGINRSGGSLLARLFDGHKDVASYPLEFSLPHDSRIYPLFEGYSGVPLVIPSYSREDRATDVFKLLDIPQEKPKVPLQWGKEHGDPIGVRKNYLEKVFYGNVKTDFDFDKFISLFNEYRKNAMNIAELYDARHRAYFEAWDNGKYGRSAKFIVLHNSGGLYLTNIDYFFENFKDSFFITPVRDAIGYIASEKTRLARRYYGSRRFSYPRFPNLLVKRFKAYDLDAQIRAWLTAFARTVLLQEKYGAEGRFIVYGNENLLNYPEKTVKSLCGKIGLEFDPILLKPTIAHQLWKGNSHQGAQEGISKELAGYYHKVLACDEIEKIEKATAASRDFLKNNNATPLDLTKLPKDCLPDYNYQKKYCNDTEKISLYLALVNTGRRRAMVKPPGFTGVLAYVYSKIIWLIHVPRMLKLRFLPGVGKQNYT